MRNDQHSWCSHRGNISRKDADLLVVLDTSRSSLWFLSLLSFWAHYVIFCREERSKMWNLSKIWPKWSWAASLRRCSSVPEIHIAGTNEEHLSRNAALWMDSSTLTASFFSLFLFPSKLLTIAAACSRLPMTELMSGRLRLHLHYELQIGVCAPDVFCSSSLLPRQGDASKAGHLWPEEHRHLPFLPSPLPPSPSPPYFHLPPAAGAS